MTNLRVLSTTGFVVLVFAAELRADDLKSFEASSFPADAVSNTVQSRELRVESRIRSRQSARSSSGFSTLDSRLDDASPKPARLEYERIQPCIGRGYVPYSYPAFDSCPCSRECCFHPGRYYCGGKEYRKQWFRKWVKAHLGRGSMLDDYPCHCIVPTAGRPYLRTVSASGSSSNFALPPAPKASSRSQE